MRPSKKLDIQIRKITCRDGKKIKLYIIRPVAGSGERLPVLFDIHGGGFVFKGAPHHYKSAKEYAVKTGRAVVFPDYRLSFDTPFGTPLSDCYNAYEYILGNSEELNLNTDEITFIGDSAGGYLSVALTKKIAEEGLPKPKAELLIYPVTDPEMKSASMQKYTDTPMWNAKCNKKMWRYYAKGHAVYQPLKDDLSFMPPTYIETAEFDCLHDDGTQLYERLEKDNVPCELCETRGTMHGYDIRMNAEQTREAIKKRKNFILK